MLNKTTPVFELLSDLIRRVSVTPDDAGCQQLIAERLTAIGFSCEWMNKNGITNLWARRGASAPLVCFAGHTDVVAPGPVEAWRSDPFTPAIIDGKVYGRGVADMKGGIAAFITALELFVASHPDHPGSLAVLLTSDEEGPAVNGTVHVVQTLGKRKERIDYCIIGEPSSKQTLGDTIKNGRRGSLSGTLVVHGVQGHVAYPQLAQNPIHKLAPVLSELLATDWDGGRHNRYFPPTSFQCSNIRAGTGATNVIPGSLTLEFNFRYSTENTVESLQNRVEAILLKHELDYTLTWPQSGKPFFTSHGDLVDHANAVLREVVGAPAELSCDGGTSDGRFIVDICRQLIELGLVNATAHKIDENVAVADLNTLATVYRKLIERLLLSKSGESEFAQRKKNAGV